jgi:hypothetical protein
MSHVDWGVEYEVVTTRGESARVPMISMRNKGSLATGQYFFDTDTGDYTFCELDLHCGITVLGPPPEWRPRAGFV